MHGDERIGQDALVLGEVPSPPLRRPVLLAGFSGWGDAGSAATIALRHLLGEEPPAASAMVSPSTCYDFTVARPITSKARGGWTLEYPKVAFHPLRLAEAEHDVLVLLGPEPHFRWPEIAPAVVTYARKVGVEMAITLGAYVGPVSHRSAPVVRRTLDGTLETRLADLDVQDSGYEGPTTFATALLHAATAGGIPAASLWVATPPYLQAGNPVAAVALLDAAQRLGDLTIPVERLRETASSFLRDVESALEEHPELAEQLREMLEIEGASPVEAADDLLGPSSRWTGPDPDRPPPDAPPGLPTGKALVEAVEHYLKQTRGEEPPTGQAG